jgi:hypothetical protein
MPRGIPGSGPNAGRGNKAKGRKTHTLADIAARSGSGQSASNGQAASAAPAAPAVAPPPAAATTGRGRGRGRASTPKTNARRGAGKANGTGQRAGKTTGKATGQRANNGQQRAGDQPAKGDGGTEVVTNGIKIEVVAVPGRGGRPQQSEAFPFAQLELTTKGAGGELVGPSFLIPEDQNPDNVLAAARKRHKGKTFTARKMEGGVRIWRLT